MSRGMEGFYKFLTQDANTITYAYSGWDFNDTTQELETGKRLDGQLILIKEFDVSDAMVYQTMMILKECQYAQLNMDGRDLFAWFTARNLQGYANQYKTYPKTGRWLL